MQIIPIVNEVEAQLAWAVFVTLLSNYVVYNVPEKKIYICIYI